MIDFDVAHEKLASLETAGELADLFRGYGVKARMRDANNCAISHWMRDQTGKEVFTNGASVRAVDTNYHSVVGMERDNTRAMKDFIALYDAGHYMDLVEEYRHVY